MSSFMSSLSSIVLYIGSTCEIKKVLKAVLELYLSQQKINFWPAVEPFILKLWKGSEHKTELETLTTQIRSGSIKKIIGNYDRYVWQLI